MWRSYLSFLFFQYFYVRIFFSSCEEAIFVFFFSSLKLGINLLPRTFAPSCRWVTCDKLSVTTNKNKQTKIIINMLFFILFWFLRVSTQLLTNRWRHEILPLWTGDCLARNHNQNVHPNTKHLRLLIFGWDPVSNGMCVRKISSEHLYASHLAADADAE